MITPPPKPHLKRLRDLRAEELPHIASPAHARQKLATRRAFITNIPPDWQDTQLDDGHWVLVCDATWTRHLTPHHAAFTQAATPKRWEVASRVQGKARHTLHWRLVTLFPPETPPPARDSTTPLAAKRTTPAPPNTPDPALPLHGPGHRPMSLGPHAGQDSPPVASSEEEVTTASPSPDGPEDSQCTKAGEPISMVSGEEFLSLTDFALPGPLPFRWKRIYRTRFSEDRGLGHGWVPPAQATLTLKEKEGEVVLWAEDGRRVVFRKPALHGKSLHLHEGMTLEYGSHACMLLTQPGQPTQVFTRVSDTGFRLTQWRHRAYLPPSMPLGVPRPARGYTLDFHYDPHGRLDRIQGNWGRGLILERNPQGRIRAIHQTHGDGEKLSPALATYDYNEAGDLIAHRNASGHGETYQYINHLLTQRTLASGYNFYFEWDELNPNAKCVKQWGDHGNYAYSFTWDTNNQRSAATNSRGHTVQYRYNAFGLITEEIDPEGHLHQKRYNDAGRLITQIDPLGNHTEFRYDEKQRLLGITDALGQPTQYGYTKEIHDEAQRLRDYTHPLPQDEVTVVVDAHRQVWQRYYTAQNLVQRLVDPQGHTTRYEYTPMGLLNKVTDPTGRITQFQWNDRAELVSQTDPQNNTLHYAYDDWGQIIEVVAQAAGQSLAHAKQKATRYAYTPTGLIAKVTNAEGRVTTLEYNDNDQLTKYTDPQGRTTQYFYDDKLSQPTKRIDPAGHVLHYHYDTERNLTTLTNENGDTHHFFYDANERLIKEIGFDGRTQDYHYNAAGHLVQHIDSAEVITEFERDAIGQLLTKHSRRVSDDKPPQRERARYQYDALGRLVETYNEHQYLRFEYDPLGHVLSETHTDLNEKRERLMRTEVVTTHRYNAFGQRIHTTLPDGQTIDYAYDASLAFETAHLNGQTLTSVQRDSLGREISRHQGALTTQTDYDPQGRLQKQFTTHKENQHQVIHREYGYDPTGNLNFFKDGNDETNYVYDALDRLAQAGGASPEFFAFDPAGNLLSITDSPTTTPGLVQGNRLLIQGDKHFTYDARGNLIKETRGKDGKLEKRFIYNLSNQLIAVESNQRDQAVTFKYDPLGRRIEKQDAFGTTTFLWTDNLLTQETRNKIKKTYIYEPQSFKPLAQIQDDKVYHYHLDHLGTPRELTNNDGKIVWKARYTTYGNLALKEIDEIENNLRFQGQYHDQETGLHYNRFRYYSPDTGQFINQDPIGLLGGLNGYQYVPNPIGWVDPWGLSCKEYNSTTLKSEYIGENDPTNPYRWNKIFGNDAVCSYLDKNQRATNEVVVMNGKLIHAAGPMQGQLVDTSSMSSLHSSGAKAIFVMDPQGRIYLGSHSAGEFHHSSFLAGMPVAAAGEMVVKDGKILEVSNESGHYKPQQSLNDQVFSELEKKGMPREALDNVMRSGVNDSGGKLSPTAQKRFTEAAAWKPGQDIPDDWADL